MGIMICIGRPKWARLETRIWVPKGPPFNLLKVTLDLIKEEKLFSDGNFLFGFINGGRILEDQDTPVLKPYHID